MSISLKLKKENNFYLVKSCFSQILIAFSMLLLIGSWSTDKALAAPDHTPSPINPVEAEWERLDPKNQADNSYEVTLEDFKKLYPNEEWKKRYVEVDSWDTVGDKVGFIDALKNIKYEYIKVIEDIDSMGSPTATEGKWDYGVQMTGTPDEKRYKIINGKINSTRNAKINFRGLNIYPYVKNSPHRMVFQNFHQYSVSNYGPVSQWNVDFPNITYAYHNIEHTGDQMLHSLKTDVYVSGYLKANGVHKFKFETEKGVTEFTSNNKDENMLVSNLTIAPGSEVNLYSESDGNIAVGGDGEFRVGEGAVINLSTRNGKSGTKNSSGSLSQPNNIIIKTGSTKGGSVRLDKKAKVNILSGTTKDHPYENTTYQWRSYSAIFFEGDNSKIELGDDAELNIDVLNSRMQYNDLKPYDSTPIVLAGSGSQLKVGKNAILNVNVKQDRTTYVYNGREYSFEVKDAPIIRTAAGTEFIVEPKGNFIVNVDIPGKRDILQMEKGALFRFNDANKIDLRFTKNNVDLNSNLINMADGHFDVDVQGVKIWKHSQLNEDEPTYSWSPMFGMNIPYKNEKVVASSKNPFIAASVSDEMVKNFKDNFQTNQGTQRLLFEHIPDTYAALEDKNGKIVGLDENNATPTPLSIVTNKKPTGETVIKGLTVPGSYVRLTAKHPAEEIVPSYVNELASIKHEVKSPVTSEGESDLLTEMKGNYTFSPEQTEASGGKFEVVLPKEIVFNPATIIHAYAFKAGKTAIAEKQVQDVLPPEAQKKAIYLIKGSSTELKAQDFVEKVKDSNPINLGFDYRFKDESQLKKNELGVHPVDIMIKDQPQNLFIKDKKVFYSEQNEATIPSELRVYDTANVIEAQDVEWKVNDILSLSASERKNKLKIDSQLKGFTINSATNGVTDKTNSITYEMPTIPNKGGRFEVEFKLNETKKKIILKVVPSDVTMTKKYVYKDQPELSIYTDLMNEDSNSIEKTVKTEKVTIGSDLNINEPFYTGYTLVETSVAIGTEVGSTVPTKVPDKDFTITYLFDGKIGITEPTDIDFNQIAVNKTGVTEHQPKDSPVVKVENTLRPKEPTKNYYLTVKLRDKIKNKKTDTAYLGALVYRSDLLTGVKNISETEALSIMNVNQLIQEVPLKSSQPDEGLILQ